MLKLALAGSVLINVDKNKEKTAFFSDSSLISMLDLVGIRLIRTRWRFGFSNTPFPDCLASVWTVEELDRLQSVTLRTPEVSYCTLKLE